jgi:hypothetical protein
LPRATCRTSTSLKSRSMQYLVPCGVTPLQSATSQGRTLPSRSERPGRRSCRVVRNVATPTSSSSSGQPFSGVAARPLRGAFRKSTFRYSVADRE